MLALALISSFTFSSCSKDEGDEGSGSGLNVVVKDNGSVSGGNTFSIIDEKNFYINDIKYTVIDGHLEVTGYDNTSFYGEAKIVESLNFRGYLYKVVGIKENAFKGCKKLTSVVIPNGITKIGYNAFDGCISLMNVDIPNSVAEIESSAFYGCSSLTIVSIPNSVTEIHTRLFEDCTSLTKVSIPSSVTDIYYGAFYGCM